MFVQIGKEKPETKFTYTQSPLFQFFSHEVSQTFIIALLKNGNQIYMKYNCQNLILTLIYCIKLCILSSKQGRAYNINLGTTGSDYNLLVFAINKKDLDNV